ncbi:MAG: carboxylesterase family protein [Bacteroidia bacterium]
MRTYITGIIILCVFYISKTSAQRYKNIVFDNVKITPDLVYGENKDVNGNDLTLMLDVYEPENDTPNIKRPLLVLAHGGSFIQGSRKSTDMVNICTEMAKRGYVAASIQYRLGVNIFSGNTLEKEFAQAVWRATQDGRAAIRWFKRNAIDTNTFGIDVDNIFTGGVSAGGVLGLHLAFLDTETELAQTTIDTNAVGGIEGNSGTPGYNWRVKGVVNLCGAISNVNFMQNNTNIKICSMHGTNDQTVPYKTNYFYFFGSPIALLQGSFSIDSMANKLGMYSDFYTFEGAPHVPFVSSTEYMDTTLNFVANSLYHQIFGKPTVFVEPKINEHRFDIYPNPVSNILNIVADAYVKINELNVLNLNSDLIIKSKGKQNINVEYLPHGNYILQIITDNGVTYKKFIKCR